VFVPGGQFPEVDSNQQGQRARTHARQTWSAMLLLRSCLTECFHVCADNAKYKKLEPTALSKITKDTI